MSSKNSPEPATILCGTDFSEPASRAVDVAGAFAKRLGERLVLVHAVNDQQQKDLPGELRDSLSLYARAQLHDEQERMRESQVDMTEVFRGGAPEAVLLQEAAGRHARLLVLAATKRKSLSHLLLGSVAEQTAEAAESPTLVVRDSEPLLRWLRQKRRLRVFVAADLSAPSEAALRWVQWLRSIGPCDVVIAYLEPCLSQYSAAALFPSPLVLDMAMESLRIQERYLRKKVRSLLGISGVRFLFEKGWWRSDAHLISMAGAARADLIVVGTHSRHGWHRVGRHSVSRGVLHYAPFNVACVPIPPLDSSDPSSPGGSSTADPLGL